VIKENFWAVALVIIFVSIIPIILELVRAKTRRETPPVVLP
jgi:hypothetical protein